MLDIGLTYLPPILYIYNTMREIKKYKGGGG